MWAQVIGSRLLLERLGESMNSTAERLSSFLESKNYKMVETTYERASVNRRRDVGISI